MSRELFPPVRRHRRRTPLRHRASEGSAYIITLMSLVVLTLITLALTFTTQTELLVGTNERVIQRAFYAAESGVHIAAARSLKSHDKCLFGTEFQDVPVGKPGSNLKAWIEYDYIYPVANPLCNLCSANNAYEYQSDAFRKVNHAISASSRLFQDGETGARKTITDMLDVGPWKDDTPPMPETCGRQRLDRAKNSVIANFSKADTLAMLQ